MEDLKDKYFEGAIARREDRLIRSVIDTHGRVSNFSEALKGDDLDCHVCQSLYHSLISLAEEVKELEMVHRINSGLDRH